MSIISSRGGVPQAPDPLSALIGRVNLYQLVESYAGSGRSQGSTTTYSCPHPQHPDRRPSFTVSTTANGKQRARCWSRCPIDGDALDFVKWLEGLDTFEAAQRLRAHLGDPTNTPKKAYPATDPRKALAHIRSAQGVEQTLVPVIEAVTEETCAIMARYLESRSWPSSVVETFSLSVVRDANGALRIRHPHYAPNAAGEYVAAYWQDRGTRNASPKWLSPTGVPPVLFNLRALESSKVTAVLICEGAPDTISAVLALGSFFPELAVLGCAGVSAWRAEWGDLLKGLTVLVCADSDKAGLTLEKAVSDSTRGGVTCVRTATNDLTDLYKERGGLAVRLLLAEALERAQEATGVKL